jgi:hypothetical protein
MPHLALIAALLLSFTNAGKPALPMTPQIDLCAGLARHPAFTGGLVAAPRLLFSEHDVRARIAEMGDGLIAAASGGPVSLSATKELIARVSACLNITLFDELRWWFEAHSAVFSLEARAELDAFLHQQTPGTLRPDPVMGVDPRQLKGEPPLPASWGGHAAYRKRSGTLFVGTPSFDSSRQGNLGDCYFLSAVSALLARRPHFFEQSLHEMPDGTVTGTFFARSDWRQPPTPVRVTVDELLPALHGKLVACSDRDPRELWPSLLEKLWAEFKGGYEFTSGGVPPDAFTALTGATPLALPIFRDSAPEAIFRFIREHELHGDAMTADTYGIDAHGDSSPAVAYGQNHLMRNHSYSLLATREAGGQRMILLRNPWGRLEQTGQAKPGTRDDGSFELPLREFLAAFAEVDALELPAPTAGPMRASAGRVTP